VPHPTEPSTLRILTPDGKTVGTGFLVAGRNLHDRVSSAGLDIDRRISIFRHELSPTDCGGTTDCG
jgi:hypothetical protein